MFGVNAAAEIFQDAIREVLPDEDGIINVSDDILISGRTAKEHNRRLGLVLKHLEEDWLTLNENKCVLGTNKLKFFGHVISSAGVSVHTEKVEAVAAMTPLKNPTEVISLLAMINYSNRFIPLLAFMIEPLRKLTHAMQNFAGIESTKTPWTV